MFKLLPNNFVAKGYVYDLGSNKVTTNADLSQGLNSYNSEVYNNDLSFISSHIWDAVLAETYHITTIGNILYTAYPLWLILTSIILLLSMVGAIIITIKR